MRPQLGVNVDHVATIRQSRRARHPDPVHAALLAELAGADQITVHLREDRRHIQDRDLRVLRETVRTRLNLEMAATAELVAIAIGARPEGCTLVPERRQELTTEGGLDVLAAEGELREVVKALRGAGLGVSLFIDPEPSQVVASARLGADAIEIHTGTYCDASAAGARRRELERVAEAARVAAGEGLRVAAGHGLDYQNAGAVAEIPEIEELNIGHAIVGHAILVGMERAVREMKTLLERARAGA